MKNHFGIWIVRAVLIVLISFWMGTIFGFSAEDGEQSQSLSDKITIKVVKIIEPDYDSLSAKEQEQLFSHTSVFVRKTGHFGEYGILGLLVSGLLVTFEKFRKLKKGKLTVVCITAGWCMVYAMTDEFHQSFVDGRSPGVLDVFIDTMGGLTATVFFALIWLFIDQKKKRTEQNKFF